MSDRERISVLSHCESIQRHRESVWHLEREIDRLMWEVEQEVGMDFDTFMADMRRLFEPA